MEKNSSETSNHHYHGIERWQYYDLSGWFHVTAREVVIARCHIERIKIQICMSNMNFMVRRLLIHFWKYSQRFMNWQEMWQFLTWQVLCSVLSILKTLQCASVPVCVCSVRSLLVVNIEKKSPQNALTLERRILWWLPSDKVGNSLSTSLQ